MKSGLELAIFVGMVLVAMAFSFGLFCLLGYGVLWVAAAFGVTLPYWPTVVGLWLAVWICKLAFPKHVVQQPEAKKDRFTF